MRASTGFAVGLLTLCVAMAANAQQTMTLGEMLDRGGRKLDKTEMRQLVPGATMSGAQTGNTSTTFKNIYSAGGSVSGDAWSRGAWFTKVSGTWTINEAGQLCQDLVNSQNSRFGACQNYYVLGSTYYTAGGDARSQPVNERTITR